MPHQYSDFFFDGNLEFRRPRKLDSQTSLPEQPESAENNRQASEDYANSIYKSYERASDKANILMKYAAVAAAKYVIPVPVESLEIRAAVNRLDKSNGSIITFELFQRCIEIIESQASKVNFSVIDTKLTADPIANERITKRTLDSRLGEDDLGGLALLGSQFFILFLLHRITGIWRSEETAATAPPLSAPEAFREFVVGIATSFAIMGINETIQFLNLQSASESPEIKAKIAGAINEARQTQLPPLVELAKKSIGLDDHKLVLKYCLAYITFTNDPGYEFWLAYFTARKTRYLSKRSRSLAPAFSNHYFSVNNGSDPTPRQILPGPLTQLSTEIVDLLNQAVTFPTDIYLCAQDYEASNFEAGLNQIVQVLDTRFTRDAICCFVRFFSRIDIEILKKIRLLLGVYSNINLIDLNRTIENFEAYFLSWVRETIERLIFSLVNILINKVISLITDFLNDISIDIDVISECPLILELIERVVETVFFILNHIREIANNYIASIVYSGLTGLGVNNIDSGYSTANNSSLYRIHKKRIIGQIIRILDAVISAIDAGNVFCDERSGKPNEITFDEVLNSPIINDINSYLDIPVNVRESYFSDASEIRFSDGSKLPSYNVGVIDIGRTDGNTSSSDCINLLNSMLPNELLKKYQKA